MNGDRPSNDTTLAAIATPARAATWASTSMPRGVPAAVTTTDPAVSRTDSTALAQEAPPYAANASPVTWCTSRTPYDASCSASCSG